MTDADTVTIGGHTYRRDAGGFYRRDNQPIGARVRQPSVQPCGPGSPAELERDPGNGALGKGQVQILCPGRVLIRIASFRRRLLDEDNLCEKYVVDCCRYAGIVRADAPGTAKIEVTQQKVGSKEPEFVRIEIFNRE